MPGLSYLAQCGPPVPTSWICTLPPVTHVLHCGLVSVTLTRHIPEMYLKDQNEEFQGFPTSSVRSISPHMGQFLQGGKNGRLMSFFFKVEPPCDQT